MQAALEVIKPGMLTTVQDLGRHGFQRYGVSVCGAMDFFSHRVANRLVGNDENAATLECTILGPTLRVLRSTWIALTGADLSPRLNGRPIDLWRPLRVEEGGELSFGSCRRGCRTYISILGGLDVSPVLGSRSTHTRTRLGGLEGRPLKRGDVLHAYQSDSQVREATFHSDWTEEILSSRVLHFLQGPQFDAFTKGSKKAFLSGQYRVSADSDRMGLRLEGQKLSHRDSADIVSDSVPFGTIQVPADGQPIVLAADRQTTGGYPRIGVLCTADFPVLAQLKPGDQVSFECVSFEESRAGLSELESEISKAGVQ